MLLQYNNKFSKISPDIGFLVLDDDYIKEKVNFTRDEHGSGLDQAEANFGWIRTGSDCNFLKIG